MEKPVKFVAYEYIGVPLHRFVDEKPSEEPVPASESLTPGFYCFMSFGGCAKLEIGVDGTEVTHGVTHLLERGGDDRNCWRVIGGYNPESLRRLSLRA